MKPLIAIVFCCTISYLGMAQGKEIIQGSVKKSNRVDKINSKVQELFNDELAEELPKVLLYKNRTIDAVSLGIIPHKVEKLTLNEKRRHAAGDFKPIHLLSLLAESLEIDPILNAISGRTKKLKKIIAVEQKLLNVQLLKENYSEYVLENFRIAETDFGRFLYFIVDDPGCNALIESKSKEKIELFICAKWVQFNVKKTIQNNF